MTKMSGIRLSSLTKIPILQARNSINETINTQITFVTLSFSIDVDNQA